jgi:hypothetical protein
LFSPEALMNSDKTEKRLQRRKSTRESAVEIEVEQVQEMQTTLQFFVAWLLLRRGARSLNAMNNFDDATEEKISKKGEKSWVKKLVEARLE